MKNKNHIKQIHIKPQHNENKSNPTHFTNQAVADYPLNIVAKSTAERGNSNNLQVANSSTPILQRAFFVRSTRTPKENALSVLLSMVGRNGQRSIVGCLPLVAVFHPVTSYRQAWKLAVDSQKSTSGVIQMIYKFLCLNRTKPTYNQETIYIEADSEENARFKLTADYRLLLNRPIAKLNPNRTACEVQGGVYA
ncbi:host cell division inhibitor Icd-like protein [Ursidibacter arcticus]